MTTPRVNVHLVLSCLLAVFLPACSPEPRSNLAVRPDDFATGWIEAWDAHDVDRILSFYTGDAFYEDVPNVENGWAEPMHGHEAIRKSLVETFEQMSDLGFELVSAFAAGDRLVVEWIMTGTHYLDFFGRFSIRGVSVITLQRNKIARVSDYYDAFLLLSQLGIVPPLGEEASTTAIDSGTR